MNIEEMDESQLRALQNRLQSALRTVGSRREAEAVKEFREIARRNSWSEERFIEIIKNAPRSKKPALSAEKAKAKARTTLSTEPKRVYCCPKNPGRTWSGHGKRPGWFIEALASGITPDQMAGGFNH